MTVEVEQLHWSGGGAFAPCVRRSVSFEESYDSLAKDVANFLVSWHAAKGHANDANALTASFLGFFVKSTCASFHLRGAGCYGMPGYERCA